MKKNKLLIIILFSFMILSLASCNFSSSGGIVNLDMVELTIGEKTLLSLKENEEVSWSSSDLDVAKIDEYGILVGVSGGIATITAKTKDHTYSILVSVSVKEESLPTLEIKGKQTISVGQGVQLTVNYTGSEVKPTISWESSNEKVATIDSSGVVTGVSTGIVTISATTVLSDITKATYTILVRDKNAILSDSVTNYIEVHRFILDEGFDLTKMNEITNSIIEKNYESTIGVSNYQYYNVNLDQKTLERAGVGTGVIFKKEVISSGYEYYVLTNYHVIDKNEVVKVYLGDRDLEIDAVVLATDSDLDLAVLKFNYSEEMRLVEFGTMDNLKAGQFILALGNAEGYDYYGSATFGVISYVNRTLKGETATFIQHDAAINPGNSGGPLFDLYGKVIGINTIKLADTDIDNMGFSITIDTVKGFLASAGITY